MRNLECPAGAHRNLEMFAPRGRSRTGVFTTKSCSLGHALHHPPLCVQVPVITAWPSATWVGCVPGTGSLGPAHRDPGGKAITSLRLHPPPPPHTPSLNTSSSISSGLWVGSLAVYDLGQRSFLESRGPFVFHLKATWALGKGLGDGILPLKIQ